MPAIDLGPAAPPPTNTLDALPRRISLTLPELRLLAEHAGGAPLPFEEATPGPGSGGLEARLGRSRQAVEEEAYAATLAALHDPAEALTRRGLLAPEGADARLVGALGLLATPDVAVDLDVVVGTTRARAWHRVRDGAVAALATADGTVFELGWYPVGQWAGDLARVAALPEDTATDSSALPDRVDLPYALLDAGAAAVRAGRPDLVATLAARHAADEPDLDPVAVTALVGAMVGETRGRLRALVADIATSRDLVGVVSWVLLAGGWHALRPRDTDDGGRVEVRRVDPRELGAALGPVLAEAGA